MQTVPSPGPGSQHQLISPRGRLTRTDNRGSRHCTSGACPRSLARPRNVVTAGRKRSDKANHEKHQGKERLKAEERKELRNARVVVEKKMGGLGLGCGWKLATGKSDKLGEVGNEGVHGTSILRVLVLQWRFHRCPNMSRTSWLKVIGLNATRSVSVTRSGRKSPHQELYQANRKTSMVSLSRAPSVSSCLD